MTWLGLVIGNTVDDTWEWVLKGRLGVGVRIGNIGVI